MIDIQNIQDLENLEPIEVSAEEAEEHGIVLPEAAKISYQIRFVGNETLLFTFQTPNDFVATVTAHGADANAISQFASYLPGAVNQALQEIVAQMDPEALAAAQEEASRA